MIAIRQYETAFDAAPRAIQRIDLSGKIDRVGNTTILFILEEAEETILDFHKER